MRTSENNIKYTTTRITIEIKLSLLSDQDRNIRVKQNTTFVR